METIQRKRWIIAPPVPQSLIAQFSRTHPTRPSQAYPQETTGIELPPILVQLLYNRGIRTPTEAAEFLHPERVSGDPFQLLGMHQAVARLRQAVRTQEPIIVYGDYDVDGVTATALLAQTLRALGAQVRPYIPHRVHEGYGLNMTAMRRLVQLGAKLLVTVDCGVRAVDEISYAGRLGMDVIVTDHHAIGPTLPLAKAIINPRQPGCKYPFPDLAGVGLTYKLAQALLRAESQVPVQKKNDLALPLEEDLLDLVALGTVADVVPLLGENRALVWQGLRKINEARRPGIRAMLAEADLAPGSVTATSIGYVLGPRLNAVGRIANAITSYKLLTSSSMEEATPLAQELGQKNRERQRLTDELVGKARDEILAEGIGTILIVAGSEYLAGVAGLVAARLAQEFYRPTIVVEVGEEESKASCRSIPEFHITAALDRCADLLLRYGGHAQAAGFTVCNEHWDELSARLRRIAEEQLGSLDLSPCVKVDAEIPLSQVDWATASMLKQLEPFGHKNPAPVLASRNVIVRRHRLVGEHHLQFTASDGRIVWDAIAFGQGFWADKMPTRIDMAYSLVTEEWNGQQRLKLYVEDLRPAGSGVGDDTGDH